MTTQNTITSTILDTYFTDSEQRLIDNYLPSLSSKGGFNLLDHLADLYYNIANFTSGELSAFSGNGVVVDSSSSELSVGITIYNDTGGTLSAGTLVRVKGYNSTNGITVEKADCDAAKPATHVVQTAISNSSSGNVYPVARVTGLATNGQTIGDPVYLSSTAGAFTFTAPTGADQLSQQVGTVKVVNASTGEIEFFPGLGEKLAFGTSHYQALSVTGAKIAASTIAGAKLTPGKGYFKVAVNTNGTTPVNVFGVGGAPTALTVTSVVSLALDTTAGNIVLKQASNTVATIAKGASAGVLVGATSLSNTSYAASDVCTVESSSAGNSTVLITFEVV